MKLSGTRDRSRQSGLSTLELLVTLAIVAVVTLAITAGARRTIGVYHRAGAARSILVEIRRAQSLAISRGGVFGLQWGADTGANRSTSEYRIVRDTTGACSLPVSGTPQDDVDVIRSWTDVAVTFPKTTIQSILDNNDVPVGKVMFNSRGASINPCSGVAFPVTVTIADAEGTTRRIQIRSAGSVRLL